MISAILLACHVWKTVSIWGMRFKKYWPIQNSFGAHLDSIPWHGNMSWVCYMLMSRCYFEGYSMRTIKAQHCSPNSHKDWTSELWITQLSGYICPVAGNIHRSGITLRPPPQYWAFCYQRSKSRHISIRTSINIWIPMCINDHWLFMTMSPEYRCSFLGSVLIDTDHCRQRTLHKSSCFG